MIDGSAIILHRTDPAKNMRRFYRLDVQCDLFGAWCFIRERGRIGRAGQIRMVPYATATEAQEALAAQQRMKERRGYCITIRQASQPSFHSATPQGQEIRRGQDKVRYAERDSIQLQERLPVLKPA